MTNNNLKTIEGVNVLNNRGHKTTPDYSIPNRTRVSINTPDCVWTDTNLTTTIPISGTESVDDCSATSGWSANGTNSVSVNSSTFKPDSGTDGALNIIKSDTSSATISVSKTVTSLDGTSKDLMFWVYVKDSTALAKISSSAVRYGSDSSNYYLYAITLSTGWNFVKIAIPSGFDSTVSSPTIASLDYFYLDIVCNNTSDTFSSGDIILDSIRLGSADDYYKTTEDLVFDETDASVSVVTKLTITEANGFLINGCALFTTDSPEKMTDKSKFPDSSKGTTDLFKITTKRKIRNIN